MRSTAGFNVAPGQQHRGLWSAAPARSAGHRGYLSAAYRRRLFLLRQAGTARRGIGMSGGRILIRRRRFNRRHHKKLFGGTGKTAQF